ncbi:MAG: ribosome recycling factor [Gammaproteobacteria bacterium]|nr:ribosome recycling factor [Gammaproteobacteria bacterium]
MLNDISKDAESRMAKAVEAFRNETKKLRTGRAHPSLLEHIKIDYYGNSTPLSQVANVAISDSRTLSITPWEKNMVQPIEKAIMNADLGLNPRTAGTVIHVPLPPLTEERRKDLVRALKGEAENGRVAVRNIRRDANSDFKELLKAKEVGEDDAHNAEEKMQKLTDHYVAEIDKLSAEKEQELMHD